MRTSSFTHRFIALHVSFFAIPTSRPDFVVFPANAALVLLRGCGFVLQL